LGIEDEGFFFFFFSSLAHSLLLVSSFPSFLTLILEPRPTQQYFGASASCVSTFKQLAFGAAVSVEQPPKAAAEVSAAISQQLDLRAATAAAAAFALPSAAAAPAPSFYPTAALLSEAEAAMAGVPVVLRPKRTNQQQQQQQMRHSSSLSLGLPSGFSTFSTFSSRLVSGDK